MAEEISISFLLNNGVAVGVMWYVLFKLNSTLKDLTKVIADVSTRLNGIENNQRQFQLQIHELKLNVDAIKRGDS